jgi:DUF917 family protein
MNDFDYAEKRRQVLRGMAGAAFAATTRPLLAARASGSATTAAPGVTSPVSPSAPVSPAPASGPLQLTQADLQNLLYGLGFAASGGGGGYLIGQALLNAIIQDIDPSQWLLYDPSQAADSDFAVMAGGIGAPSAITPETILNFVGYANLAIQAYSNNEGVTVNALVPVEAGPVNAMLALYLGWKNGYKVFDCDGAGRAVPSLTNLVYAYNSYPIAPVWLGGVIQGDPTPLLVSPPPANAAAAEAAIRDNLGQFGDAAGLVCWGQTGTQLRESTYLLPQTLSNLISFGAQAAATGFSGSALLTFLQSSPLVSAAYSGFVTNITTGSEPGYDDGFVLVGTASSTVYQIHYLNENLILTTGKSSGTVLATAPSGIAMLFQPLASGPFQLLNNGDNLTTQSVIGYPIIIAVMQESCELFEPAVAPSFTAVLAAAPFNYTGGFVPGTCSSGGAVKTSST